MKTKLTPELQEKIIKYIKAGNYNKVACQMVGICEDTYYEWLKRGKKGESPYSEFSESARQAEAEAEIRNVTIIQIAAKLDWRAALEILARKYHARWGKKELVGGIEGSPIEIKTKDKDLENELIKKLDIIRERVNANEGKKQ